MGGAQAPCRRSVPWHLEWFVSWYFGHRWEGAFGGTPLPFSFDGDAGAGEREGSVAAFGYIPGGRQVPLQTGEV